MLKVVYVEGGIWVDVLSLVNFMFRLNCYVLMSARKAANITTYCSRLFFAFMKMINLLL